MRRIKIVVITVLILTLVLMGCVTKSESESMFFGKDYTLSEIAPNVIMAKIDTGHDNPSSCVEEALKEISATHTIQNCVPITEKYWAGSRTASVIVFVEPKEASVP